MRRFLFLFVLLLVHCFTAAAQQTSGLLTKKLFFAQRYDQYDGATRLARVRELQEHDWQAVDSTKLRPNADGLLLPGADQIDLAPYVNDIGQTVYWVPEVAPVYPGGTQAMQQYIKDALFMHQPTSGSERQSQIYIRCTIDLDGRVTDVWETTAHRDWIPESVVTTCLDAVRYMPPWTPGLLQGKPVRVNRLITFQIHE